MTEPSIDAAPQAAAHTRQFLLWLAVRPRTYADTMDAWRTSCPRLSAWEDAVADALIRVDSDAAASQGQAIVCLTDKGAALLDDATVTTVTTARPTLNGRRLAAPLVVPPCASAAP